MMLHATHEASSPYSLGQEDFISSSSQRPASYCHGVVSVVHPSVHSSICNTEPDLWGSGRSTFSLYGVQSVQLVVLGCKNCLWVFFWSVFNWFFLCQFYQNISPSICSCVHKLFLQKPSYQKLLTGFLPNFTDMFCRWSSFKFLQIIMFHEEFWLPCNQSKQSLKIFSSQTTNWIALLFCRNVP